MIAPSFGFLASNNSATRGKPPVISFVLDVAFGNLARTSPALTFDPSATDKIVSLKIQYDYPQSCQYG